MNYRSFLPFVLQNLIWIPTKICLSFFIRFSVSGLENLRGHKGAAIFASNHTSEIDPILIPAALPMFSRYSPMFYVSRERSFYIQTILRRIFYGGFFFNMWGAYEACGGISDYARSLEPHIDILQHGGSVNIFPEGKMGYEPGIFHEAKGGVAFLSYATRTCVIPVAISGAHRITLSDFFLRKRHISIKFGKPITVDDLYQGISNPEPSHHKRVANDILLVIRGMLQEKK